MKFQVLQSRGFKLSLCNACHRTRRAWPGLRFSTLAIASLLLGPVIGLAQPGSTAQDNAAVAPANALPLDDLFGTPSDEVPHWISPWSANHIDWSVSIAGNAVTLHSFRVQPSDEILIPRLIGAVQSLNAEINGEACKIELVPETKQWRLRWSTPSIEELSPGELTITLTLNDSPFGIEQVKPQQQRVDGTIALPAEAGQVSGKLLRFEPQPYKHTIGYWAIADDTVQWTFHVDQPGTFSIAVLAGCGAGQGGSTIGIQINHDQKTVGELDLSVIETGNFQNFRWNSVGLVKLETAGDYALVCRCKKLAVKAAADIRQIDLIRQAMPVVLTPLER